MQRIVFRKSAAKQLKKLQKRDQARVLVKIRALDDDPHPSGSESVKNAPGFIRVRVGDYRVVYSVVDEMVEIARIGHRREVYERLDAL